MRDGRFYPGPRPRPHRRLPRAPGRPLRRGRRRAEPRARQADPHRHRAGRTPTRPTPGRPPCGRAGGSPTRAATAPSPRSATSTATPATGPAGHVEPRRRQPAVNPVVVLGRAGADPRRCCCSSRGAGRRRVPRAPSRRRRRASPRRRPRRRWRRRCCRSAGRPACCRATSTSPRSRTAIGEFAAIARRPVVRRRRRRRRPGRRRSRADTPLIPASNQKLLVGAVALEVLGDDHTYTTEARAAAAPGRRRARRRPVPRRRRRPAADELDVSDARTTRTRCTSPTSLDALADAIVAAGVQRIDGAVVGDASPLRRRVLRAELGQRRARHRGRTVRRPAGQRRPGHGRPAAGVGPGRAPRRAS